MSPRPALLALALLFLGGDALAAPRSVPTQDWPFGVSSDRGAARGRDLYNLGLIGAKASDAVKGEPEPAGQGTRRVTSSGDDGPDDGPEKLRVEVLFPDGPAARAGLVVGDVIVGIGGRDFDDGCFEPLAKALLKEASGREAGEIDLRVERADGSGTEKVTVAIESLGKDFAKPTKDDGRALLGERALAWLAERQDSAGGYRQTLSGINGAVVQTCMAGLAWIAGGSNLDEGPYRENLERAVEFVKANVGKDDGMTPSGGANWNQENWGWVHAGIFLGELQRVSPRDELVPELQRIVDAIQGKQEETGGYAHGPGGPNALGYVELNIVGGFALCALGLAQQAGCTIDEERVEALLDYLERSSGDGVGYSVNDGQVGIGNIGRTAVTWLGLRTLGEGKGKFASSLAGYVKRNSGDVLGGHASLMQHVLLAGLAGQAQGGAAEKGYWEAMERDLVLALAPDGSFQPRPWAESLRMASNSDVSFGEVWTTACWACVLLCQPPKKGPGGLPGWLGE